MSKYNLARIQTGTGEVKRFDIAAQNFFDAMAQAHKIIRGMRKSKTGGFQPHLVEVTSTNKVGMFEAPDRD